MTPDLHIAAAPPRPGTRGRTRVAASRASLGFRDGHKGAHLSRTMMLPELTVLLSTAPPSAPRDELRRLIVEENLLGKRTASNRGRADAYLSQLYGLDPAIPIYRLLRRLWDADPTARPALALLTSCARDPLLRAAAPGLLAIPVGEAVDAARLTGALSTVASRFTPATLASTSRNVGATFTQSGYLRGKLHKVRVRASAAPVAAVMAAALGWMEGARGQFLLDSFWSRLLDRNPAEVLDLLLAAGRAGWLDIRSAAGVLEVRMDRLLTPAEMELCHGQSD